ncbi:uncharacterized protein BJX67DRAFT_17803 [Aspergillus lucknowensis]|uniref:Uncharacterized protein n=1 Tax=Aspergillus lucknowensis TaxID=176173 RepID=A0ABR4M824_9EURO
MKKGSTVRVNGKRKLATEQTPLEGQRNRKVEVDENEKRMGRDDGEDKWTSGRSKAGEKMRGRTDQWIRREERAWKGRRKIALACHQRDQLKHDLPKGKERSTPGLNKTTGWLDLKGSTNATLDPVWKFPSPWLRWLRHSLYCLIMTIFFESTPALRSPMKIWWLGG